MELSVLFRQPRPPFALPCPWRTSSIAMPGFMYSSPWPWTPHVFLLEDEETSEDSWPPSFNPARKGATNPPLASPAAAVGSSLGSGYLGYRLGDHADAGFATTRQYSLLRSLPSSVLCHQIGYPVLFLALSTIDEAPSLSKQRSSLWQTGPPKKKRKAR